MILGLAATAARERWPGYAFAAGCTFIATATGTYAFTVRATWVFGRESLTADQAVTLEVAVPVTPSPTGTRAPSDPPNPSALPDTGSSVSLLVGVGLLMVVAGGAVTWLVRRRRVATS